VVVTRHTCDARVIYGEGEEGENQMFTRDFFIAHRNYS
jgi:hypothetical protein